MGRYLHTPLLLVVVVSVVGACSFDTSVAFDNALGGSDAGFFSPDAGGEPDAERSLSPDASPVDPGPDAAPPVPEGTLESHPFSGELELDGDLDLAWQSQYFIEYDINQSDQLLAIPSYAPDAAMRFASLYDSETIYFFFEVTDDLLINDSTNLYNDDSVELYIDGLNDLSGPYDDDDHWVVISSAGNYQSLGPDQIDVTGFIKTTATGYNIEIALSRDELGALSSASTFGFNIGLNDDDDMGDSGVDAYGLWHLPSTQSCVNCCTDEVDNYAWCDTTRLGQLLLLP